MKKSTLFIPLIAAGMLPLSSFGQAAKFVLFEHFTQASCGPCAAQNPAFQANILNANPGKVRHIAYHTSWPGVDPMYNHNATENDARTQFYGVNGVPHVEMMGNVKEGAPGAFTQADVDEQFVAGSPIKIEVSEIDQGSTRDVTVIVTTVSAPPSGSFTLRTAIIENPIQYSTPPGNNGETDFPNVFRKMLPSIAGDPITLPAVGNSVTFNYTYTEDAAWQMNNIKLVAFVQNNTTKEILNSGSNFDPIVNYNLFTSSSAVQAGTTSAASAFNFTSANNGTASEQFTYTLTSTAPGNWSANFNIGAVTYTSTATVTVAAGATENITVNVTPGSTPAVAKYTLTVSSATNPSSPSMTRSFYVISGVTDLVVSNSGWVGDGTTPGNASNWENDFLSGLQYAGNTGYASTDEVVTAKAIQDNALTGVNNIYFNVGWTFPSLTDDLVAKLTTFLNAGGNLFISGQDIGWDTWDANGSGTANTQTFYTNFLGAAYSNDGGTANTQLTTQTSDPIWGNMPNATISNSVYGSQYFFPDELTATGTGVAIYKYNTSTTKVAGVRNTNGTWKTVYIAPGVEMLSTAAAKNEVIKRAHDWFYGYLSTEEFDKAMLGMGQNFPNPATGITTIPLSNIENAMQLEVVDLTGRVVLNQEIAKGAESVQINTLNLENGLYMYRIVNGSSVSNALPMQVIH